MMTNIDFAPLFRSSIGFDRVFDLLENSLRVQNTSNWPPYDIVREGEDAYRITIAVAGFSQDELTLTYEPNLLVVKGNKAENGETKYLHRGLTNGAFERRFELADYVEVADARLEYGLLTVWLKRELPEAMKPHKIAIASAGQPVAEPKQIEDRKQAA
ncbi:Hsp20 family protein [Devosia sp. CN2-171]|uniref:Hsp20 family protein n=1 Tax=Devosia sp. CN2-171 TaxID=3400909 RepID=UPI003BF900A1